MVFGVFAVPPNPPIASAYSPFPGVFFVAAYSPLYRTFGVVAVPWAEGSAPAKVSVYSRSVGNVVCREASFGGSRKVMVLCVFTHIIYIHSADASHPVSGTPARPRGFWKDLPGVLKKNPPGNRRALFQTPGRVSHPVSGTLSSETHARHHCRSRGRLA